jgi:hypothetical protein
MLLPCPVTHPGTEARAEAKMARCGDLLARAPQRSHTQLFDLAYDACSRVRRSCRTGSVFKLYCCLRKSV